MMEVVGFRLLKQDNRLGRRQPGCWEDRSPRRELGLCPRRDFTRALGPFVQAGQAGVVHVFHSAVNGVTDTGACLQRLFE